MIALKPHDIGLALAVAVVSWPVFNLIDRIAYGLQVAGALQ